MQNVKNTMLDKLVAFVAPHHCYECSKIGTSLCHSCQYDIVSDGWSGCIVCSKPAGSTNICARCGPAYSRAWCAAERTQAIKELIDSYKFRRSRDGLRCSAELLEKVLPDIPPDVTIVPVPTIRRHIRTRGFDHTLLIAGLIAECRGLKVDTCLQRLTSTQQFGTTARERKRQAAEAFGVLGRLSGTYLLIDDVLTTGSTLHYAAHELRSAGAEDVWVAVISRQPLD